MNLLYGDIILWLQYPLFFGKIDRYVFSCGPTAAYYGKMNNTCTKVKAKEYIVGTADSNFLTHQFQVTHLIISAEEEHNFAL